MKLITAALCALCLTTPAQDDPSTRYRQAFGTFLPGGGNAMDARATVATALQSATGNWMPMSDVTQGAATLDAEFLAQYCGRGGDTLAAPTPYRFTLTQTRGDRTFTRTFDYVIHNTFQMRADDAEFLAFMGATQDDIRMAMQLLSSSQRFGPVTVLWPSPDIMVLQPQAGPASIYVRCP